MNVLIGLIPLVALSPWGFDIAPWIWIPALLVILFPLVIAVGIWLSPLRFVRFMVGAIVRILYRVKIYGMENIPSTGPVLVTANHISWMDGFLVELFVPRHVNMIVYAGNFKLGWIQYIAKAWRAIMINPGPKSIVLAIRAANERLRQGEVVGIFPEGGVSRSGQLNAFKGGLTKIIQGTDAVVVPVYLDGLWGSILSYSGGKFFWKWPEWGRRTVSIYFGKPLETIEDAHQVRQAVQSLGTEAMQRRKSSFPSVSANLVRACKKRKFRSKIADTSGADITGGETLLRALILRRLLRKHVLAASEKHIGILLPPSVGGVITNLALTLDRRVPVNLNYTVSASVLNECLALADIKHILTSRQVMEKLGIPATELQAEIVYLEDLKGKVSLADKVVTALATYVVPAPWVISWLGLERIDRDELLTIIFTSGSTGIPKGVMLTYANVMSNVSAINQVIHLNTNDIVVGILPFFHSFGFTVTLWSVAALDIKGIYHFNPLDARQVGKLVRRHRGNILLATPTFLRSYLRRCEVDDFASLDTVVVGAERLPPDLSDAFEKKFGIRPVEGYGTTELSPLVSVNIPKSRELDTHQSVRCEGTVGRCIPGVSAKVVDPDSNQELTVDQEGMLLIQGPNVMKGYLKAPEKTAEVLHDGWYVTGDMARIDAEGFIHITGRLSRFSKIGGEMVPHGRIEDVLLQSIGSDDDSPVALAVAAVPDAKKGERIVVLHTAINKTPQEMIDALKAAGLPNLYIPSPDSFVEVPSLPILGTGKLDLRGIKQLALSRFTVDESSE